MSTTTKILHRDVMRLHDRWADAASRFGDNNLSTSYAAIDYRKAREAWEAQSGKPFTPKHRS